MEHAQQSPGKAFHDEQNLMLLAILGPPTHQTHLATKYVQLLVRVVFGKDKFQKVKGWKLADAKCVGALGSDAQNARSALVSTHPDQALVNFLIERSIPIVLLRASLSEITFSSMICNGMGFDEALALATRSTSTLSAVPSGRSVYDVQPVTGSDSVAPMISILTQAAGLTLPRDQIQKFLDLLCGKDAKRDKLRYDKQILRHFPDFQKVLSENEEKEWRESLMPAQRDQLLAFGSSFDALTRETALSTEIDWPLSLSNLSGPKKLPLASTVDLTGKARTIIQLPSVRLPHGRWKAIINLSVIGNQSGNFLILQAQLGDKVMASGGILLPSEGLCEAELLFDVEDAQRPFSLHLSLKFGAIEGRLALQRIRYLSVDLALAGDRKPFDATLDMIEGETL